METTTTRNQLEPRTAKRCRRPRLAALVALAALCGLSTAGLSAEAADPAAVFAWDDAQIDVGWFYHYTFSDLEGKGKQDYYLYFPDKNHMQYVQNHYLMPYQRDICLLTYTIDPSQYGFSASESQNLLLDANKSWRFWKNSYDRAAGKIRYTGVTINGNVEKNEQGSVDLPKGVNIFYNDVGSDIALLFRFLKPGALPFKANFIDVLRSNHEVIMRMDKLETVDGIPCQKYAIEGQGLIAKLSDANGAVWMASDGGQRYLVKFTMNARFTWEIPHLMVKLAERKPMTADEWQSFQTALVEQQQKRGRF
jgi:hypothetical protein